MLRLAAGEAIMVWPIAAGGCIAAQTARIEILNQSYKIHTSNYSAPTQF